MQDVLATIADLKTIEQEMGNALDQQADVVDHVEVNVEDGHENIIKGNEELLETLERQDR